ncbi:MAG: VanZ family protein [Bacteroides sp.]|nr:VanZ family protein [Bacteroides sp.]
MKQTQKRTILFLLLIASVLGFIWVNSMLPMSVSGGFSAIFSKILIKLAKLPLFAELLGHVDPTRLAKLADLAVRKIAHATEFGVLGIALAAFYRRRLRSKLPLLAFAGLFAAAVDETIQLFSAGRTSQLVDVWIDFAGFTLGVALVALIVVIRRKKQTRRGK